MIEMLKKAILSFCSFASIISLAFITGLPIWARILIVVFGVGCLAYLLWSDYASQRDKLFVCKSEEETQEYMKKWIKNQGKVCVMSRDLSWVNTDIEEVMKTKKGSLRIFAQQETELTKRLRASGVDVRFYGCYNFEPKTRFTIIRYNRPDKQIAIANTVARGKKLAYEHTIYQTDIKGDMKDTWIVSLADDLVGLCDIICEREDEDAEEDGAAQ